MIARASIAAAGLAALGVLAAGCGGGGKSPSVASLGTASTTTTTTPSAGPSGGGPVGGKGNPQDLVKFQNCMQKHHVNVQVDAGGGKVSIGGDGIDPNSPQFQAAQQACRKYLPGGGPKALTPAQQAQQVQLMRKLSQCMRKNGVPDFPDPGSDGTFSLNKSGDLNPSSTSFQHAMQTCQSQLKGQGPMRIGIRAGGPIGGSGH